MSRCTYSKIPRSYVVLFVLMFAVFGCGAGDTEETPAPPKPQPMGRIRGVVRFSGEVPKPAFEAITQDQTTCGNSVSVTRLAVGKSNGVRNAFVYLDGIPAMEDFRPRESVLVDQKECQYAPHALVVPAGTKLEVTNSDPILHNVHAHENTGQGPQTLFNLAQPVRGQRTLVEQPLTRPGIITLTCEAGHPWMFAYVFVANHPFVKTTDEEGRYVIADVPAGTYTIKMWHEGVRLKRNIKSLQRYEYEEPYETTHEVVVEPGGEAVVNFDLDLRPAG